MSKQKLACAFIGLGAMGFPMAGHLASVGHSLRVYNRTASKARAWTGRHQGVTADTPREAARDADFIFTCVGNDDDLRSVMSGRNGVLAGAEAGAVIVDHTTTSARVARELYAQAAARSLSFLDAPVSGGQVGAENGRLSVMAGGDEAIFTRARPVLEAYAETAVWMGPSGAGQLTKMVNQICIGGLLQGLSEALVFSGRAGLDSEKVLSVISKGAAQSWQMENRGKTMVKGEFDFGFAVDWMRKDLGIVLDEAKHNGARLPVTALVDQFYAQVQARGGGRWDTSSLIDLLTRD